MHQTLYTIERGSKAYTLQNYSFIEPSNIKNITRKQERGNRLRQLSAFSENSLETSSNVSTLIFRVMPYNYDLSWVSVSRIF